MDKSDFNKKIAAIIISIIGVLGVIGTFISMPEDQRNIKITLIIICFSLLSIALVLFIDSIFDIKNAFNILLQTKKLGITQIKSDGISGNNVGCKLKNAKTVKIIATTALIFFRTREDEFIKALENNANISIIISTQNSDFITETEDLETRKRGEINNEIEQVISTLNRIEKEAIKNTRNQLTGKIGIKQFNTQLKLPMIIIDDSFVWLTLTFPPKRSAQSPSFAIKKVNNGILENCVKHFDELWSRLESDIDISKIDFDEFMKGKWKVEVEGPKVKGSEYFELKDRKYLIDKTHWFNIDQVSFDYNNRKISFRKVGVKEGDNRKLVNDLKIENENKLIGLESGINKMTYYRL